MRLESFVKELRIIQNQNMMWPLEERKISLYLRVLLLITVCPLSLLLSADFPLLHFVNALVFNVNLNVQEI